MSRRSDAPVILMRVTPRGLVPLTARDAEGLASLPKDSHVEIRPVRVAQSPALRAWWLLCSRTADALSDQNNARSVSNSILLTLGMVEQEALVGGGTRRVPMSLTDFGEDQLWRLVEAGKLHVAQEIVPGVDIEALLKTRSAA